MPIKSRVQWKYLKAYHPKIFERFQKENPINYKDLPERISKIQGGNIAGEDISLSEDDLRRLLPGVKIVSYPDLEKYKSLEELLYPNDEVIILYLKRLKDGSYDESYGHWVGLFRNKGIVSFFDSYGGKPDDYKQIEPYLSKLLLDYSERKNVPIEYNDHQFQKWEPDIATCGRHTAMRIAFKDLPLKDYIYLFKDTPKFDSDEIVTALTQRDNEGGCECEQ
ncbi:MAG TPA: hypothetical protein VK590_02035 [Saprospiraceae bacterium]|nr:hypothetical protein [Saprospiraceae bacterium]